MSYKDLDSSLFSELVSSEQMFRRIAELTHDLIVQTDIAGKIKFISPSVKPLLGYEQRPLFGQSVFDLVYVADKVKAEETFKQVITEGKDSRAFIRLLRSKGDYIWADISVQVATDDAGKVVGTFAVARDVTEQVTATELLKKVNRELRTFRLAVENAFNHIIVTDPEGKIMFANKGVERVTQYSVKEVLGKTPALWGRQMPAAFYKDFWKQVKDNLQPFHGEIINKRKDGTLYRALATVSPILDEQDKLLGFVGVEEDISLYKPPSK